MDQRVHFLARLRDARALVLRDAESFHEASTVLEHIGQMLTRKIGNGLATYENAIVDLATNGDSEKNQGLRRLFNVVRVARNKAVHDGAFARHLSSRLIELTLLLEESIMQKMHYVEDLMVRNPVTAEPWHLVAHVRRAMLANSFSNIPVFVGEGDKGKWKLLTDTGIVRYIRKASNKDQREERLALSIADATDKHGLGLLTAECRPPGTSLPELVANVDRFDYPVLVTKQIEGKERLLGIITAFDLL